ncbi:MAG: PhzF family phenazine biosynthesis protein [Gammaproteobacteria bacterium]|nr:PhzF family phenazine biosynthesis protein [Gammaproteobacteria bacterium]
MKLRLFQIDAFTSDVFGGNPAAVVPLSSWLDDELMQQIAAENNLSETAFFVPGEKRRGLRWFTPEAEIKLCGHATLASAFAIFTELEPGRGEVRFDTLSGELTVTRSGDRLVMDFPVWRLERLDAAPAALAEALGTSPAEVLVTAERDNYFAVLGDQSEVESLAPDMQSLAALHPAGVAVTAPGRDVDFVCRYFAPSYGVAEDPATGSIQCGLMPYWVERLGRNALRSRQVSRRGAEFFSELRNGRTFISGSAVKYLEGWIEI